VKGIIDIPKRMQNTHAVKYPFESLKDLRLKALTIPAKKTPGIKYLIKSTM